jgi:aspartate aminotransferase
VTTGNSEFVHHAVDLIFGSDSAVVRSGDVASAQTISGTGAIHIALMFLSNSDPNSGLKRTVFVGTPTWGNIVPMCKLTGLEVKTYNHYLPETGQVDWESILSAVGSAPKGSIFYLQRCCHNPTSADPSRQQWEALAQEMKDRQLLPLFDIAYHGLGNGIDEDVFCVRHFERIGLEMLVCQSFSKNFGLYGERVGAVHAVCEDARAALAVRDQFRFLIRSEFGSSPIYGARIVTSVLGDPVGKAAW